MIRLVDASIVWGVCAPKKLVGSKYVKVAGAKIRYRMRNNGLAEVFIKTGDGIRKFFVVDCGDYWKPKYEQGRNMRKAA